METNANDASADLTWLWVTGLGAVAIAALVLAIVALVNARRSAKAARQATATAQWAVAELHRLTGSGGPPPPFQAPPPAPHQAQPPPGTVDRPL
ncbi:hypothetical protein LX16_0448 [Stackebrandtia albiflava]|uniref:Uncharacterized protein n=1 Tax=Stackebrandtia albiflava TaxID=406432 RepID=A0A562VA82_9ACTN|nr:hypothetical protein [Stackebrandtia albiflava]TWJ14758.1 hypothetical protein LX16_0448 [Stackebrandtia albiflava]